ncbi:urease accessory protein UreD [Clostridium sp. DJ247]|uniref:urease accessory protein UreD n=1 Tax=Clostridium sp. DJ247 TaxID=2726188 RepID=UPI001624D9A6|nr:urease accessory protein UreD [Clostridium sp. DJ247]MBC2581206.1 hypothetical protein [Clostridium sp. DJ247]
MINNYQEDSFLKVKTQWKNNKTVLKDCYFTAPLKITKPFYDYENNTMKLCVMNTSPGVLEGDRYIIEFNLNENSRLHVYSQSYNKIFNMKEGYAFQKLNINLSSKSRFEYFVQPTLPFKGANFKGSTDVNMDDDSTLVYREIISCGRYRREEIFEFKKYSSLTKISYNGKLIFLDNTVLEPEKQELWDIGFYEGFTHQANVFIVSSNVNEELREGIVSYLNHKNNIVFGASISCPKVLIIRMLGKNSEELCKITEYVRNMDSVLKL